MGIFMTSSLILFMALAAGCHGNPAIGRRNEVCQYVSMSCLLTSQTMLAMFRAESQSQIPQYPQLCQIGSHFTQCLGECMDEIMKPATGRVLSRSLEYMCHESREDRIGEIISAQCFLDGTFQRSYMGKIEECNNNTFSDLRSAYRNAFSRGEYNIRTILCPLVDNFKDCIFEGMVEMCGEEVAPLAQDIINILFREVSAQRLPISFSCPEQVTGTHNIMKRAV